MRFDAQSLASQTGLTIVFLLILLLSSCKYFNKSTLVKDKEIIARVQDAYLYYSDIEHIARNAGGTNDSASIVRNYVDDWVKRKLMLEKALQYLPPEKLDINKQVNDYRESLILYKYEMELILQKLDTVVDETILLNYFDEYKTNFVLKDDIIQMLFVKVPKDAPRIDSLVLWMGSRDDKTEKIEGYCHQYAVDFSISDTLWFDKSTVYNNIPMSTYQLEMSRLYKSTLTVNDSLFNYVVRVNNSKDKGETAPYHYVKDDIIRIILNKRKKELVRSTFENVYLEGKRANKFEIYK